MIRKKHLFLPKIPDDARIVLDESEIERSREILTRLNVPSDEHPLMLGTARLLPDRLLKKRESLRPMGLSIFEDETEKLLRVEISDGTKLDFPVFLTELTIHALDPEWRIEMDIGSRAVASLIMGSPVPPILTAPADTGFRLRAGRNSNLRLSIIHSYHDGMMAKSTFSMEINENAHVETSILTLQPGRQTVIEGDVTVASGAHFRLSDTGFATGDGLKASWIHAKLVGESATAELNSADFNFDRSESRTAFFIEVLQGARGAVGRIFSSGLNFSESARQMFLPGLITHEEEVDLHHGASSGKWTAEQMEYLRSRGLSSRDIALLLVESLLGSRVYPMLSPRLVNYARFYIARIFENREIAF